MKFDDDVKHVIPSLVNVVASASDNQQSEESYNVRKFELPNPAGKSGGACTTAFLKQQYITAADKNGASWMTMLEDMQALLKSLRFSQTPTLSSSRKITSSTRMEIVPPGSGTRRALLIGINYVGQTGELQSCHNDCQNVREFLKSVHSFRDEEMMVLMDDGLHSPPTKENIENGFILLTKYSQPGDVVFVSFSGHGGRTKDLDGDEADGWDSTIFPVDFNTTGQIVDDDILNMLVKPMAAGVTTTALIDCCHSGSVVDLPYTYAAGDSKMQRVEGFNMDIVTESVRPPPRGPRKREKKARASNPHTKAEKSVVTASSTTGNDDHALCSTTATVSATPSSNRRTSSMKETYKAETAPAVKVSTYAETPSVKAKSTAHKTTISLDAPKAISSTRAHVNPTESRVLKATTTANRIARVEPSRKIQQSNGTIFKDAYKQGPKPISTLQKARPAVVGKANSTALSASTLTKAEEIRQARRMREEAERQREAS